MSILILGVILSAGLFVFLGFQNKTVSVPDGRGNMTQMMSRGPVTGSDFSCSDTITEYKCCGRECAHRLIKGLCGQDYSAVVVISALPCSGPVPIDQFERSWRDEVGKACQVIAMYSSEVYRMLCGIPQRLK